MWWLSLAMVATAGPWTRDAGSYYVKGGGDAYVASEYVQAGTSSQNGDRFLGQQYAVYGELGLSRRHPVSLSGTLPLSVGTLWFTRRDNGAKAEGRATVHRIGDVRLMPQVALHPDKPIAAALEVKLPMYRVDSVCANNAQFKELCPRPGDGQVDLTPWILAGAGWEKAFAEVGVGYLHRTEWYMGWDTDLAFQDSVVFSAGGGHWFGPALAMLKLDGNVAPSDDLLTPQALRLGPAALVDITEGIGLEARASRDLWVRNGPRGTGFGLGISARR